MGVYMLPDEGVDFPDPKWADPEGLLALGGGLSPQRLISAYANGIFPWYDDTTPILWWSPDPRFVLFPDKLHIPRSLRRVINSRKFTVTMDTVFPAVIRACATAPRPDQEGTWLVEEMIDAYRALHDMGIAHSIEVWRDDELVGGLYGISLGSAFYGESMFFREADASKVALVWLVRLLAQNGFTIIDCQQTTDNLGRFGAEEIPRFTFIRHIKRAMNTPTRQGQWVMPEDFFPL